MSGPPNMTEQWQPVDSGVDQWIKMRMRGHQNLWLQGAGNWRKWVSGGLTATEKRVLVTVWFAEALLELWEKKTLLWAARQHGGCHVTLDAESLQQVKLKGVEDWIPPGEDHILSDVSQKRVDEDVASLGARPRRNGQQRR